MLTLILMRHAKSDHNNLLLRDFDRPLNKRGIRNAGEMGEWLHKHVGKANLTLCSPAKRTRETLEGVHKKFNQGEVKFEDSIYEASITALYSVIAKQKAVSTLMLIGHNPAITYLAQSLSGVRIDNIPTAGVVIIDFDCNSWNEITEGNGELRLKMFPKELED